MTKKFDVLPLISLAKVETGKHDANYATLNGKYRFYTCASDFLHCDTYRFEGECIILPGNGANVGEVYYYNGEFDAYQRTYVIHHISNAVIPRYLFYHLINDWKTKGVAKQYGAATNYIKIGNFEEYKVRVCSLDEQQRIVSLLDAEFAKIDTLKANAERNLQNAKDLFQAALKKEFSGNNTTLGSVLNLRRGHDLTHGEMKEGGIPVAGSGGVIGYHNEATPIQPCITVGRSGSVGKVRMYEKCWAHNTVLYVDDFKGNTPSYLSYLLLSLNLQKQGGGCGVPTLNRNNLHPITIGYNKDIAEQQRIVNQLDNLSNKCKTLQANYEKTLSLYDDLKQALLRKAFNGEI